MSDWVLSIAGAGEFPIYGSSATLGRDASCDLALGPAQSSVSRKHAQLEPYVGGVWITDLGSSNGTRINGMPVTTRALAGEGDTIEFGTVRAVLRRETPTGRAADVSIEPTVVAPAQPYYAPPPSHPAPTVAYPAAPPPPVAYAPPPPPPAAYAPPAAPYPAPVEKGSDILSVIGMTMAVVSGVLTLVALMPCLGWINWITIAGGGIAHILNWIAFAVEGRYPVARNRAIIGLVITAASLAVGCIRLFIGSGCF